MPADSQDDRVSESKSEIGNLLDEISITIAFALLVITWLTLRRMDGREHRRTRR